MTFASRRLANWATVWVDYSPTLVNFTLGDGAVVARFSLVQNTVTLFFEFTLGSTSAVGSNPTFTLPSGLAASASTYTTVINHVGQGYMREDGIGGHPAMPRFETLTTVSSSIFDASGTFALNASVTATQPFTWGTSDVYQVTLTYETDFA